MLTMWCNKQDKDREYVKQKNLCFQRANILLFKEAHVYKVLGDVVPFAQLANMLSLICNTGRKAD